MTIRVNSLMVSLDGFAAGADQSLEAPMGIGGQNLSSWMWTTEFGRSMRGMSGGSTGVDNSWLRRGEANVGATVMGRNMFGPIRGQWPDELWNGWWGDEPPYHHPVFVLTHYPRPHLSMEGGTTFHFVTGGLVDALEQATKAAAGKDVRIGGGVSTVREALRDQLVDELHVCIVPVLLHSGERLWEDLGTWPQGYICDQIEASESVAHIHFSRGILNSGGSRWVTFW